MIRVDAALKLGAFDLDIEFENDEGVTALFGRSGSGKSTTINLRRRYQRAHHAGRQGHQRRDR